MQYQDWLTINEEELRIECAESGADRELDFDFDKFCEDRFNAVEKIAVKHYGVDPGSFDKPVWFFQVRNHIFLSDQSFSENELKVLMDHTEVVISLLRKFGCSQIKLNF